jgi:hypothetical protein
MSARARKRPGSRLLLGLALVAGTLAAMYGAARVADVTMDLLGIASRPARLAGKTLFLAAAVPGGFLLVERAFLHWASRRKAGADRKECPPGR